MALTATRTAAEWTDLDRWSVRVTATDHFDEYGKRVWNIRIVDTDNRRTGPPTVALAPTGRVIYRTARDRSDAVHGHGNSVAMLGAALDFLYADAESYTHYMGEGEPEDGYLFGPDVAEWAYQQADAISMAAVEIAETEVI